MEYCVSNLIKNNNLSKDASLGLQNIRSYLIDLQTLGGDRTITWPVSIQYFLASQYCEELGSVLEQLFKIALPTQVLETRNDRGQMLKSLHHLDVLLDHFIENHPMIDEKIPGFSSFVRSLRIKNGIGRHENLKSEGTFGQLLADLEKFIDILPSIEEGNLDDFTINFCTKRLGKDASQWGKKLKTKIHHIEIELLNIGDKLIKFGHEILALIMTNASMKPTNVFSDIKKEFICIKTPVSKKQLKGIANQYEVLLEQCLSKDLQKVLPKNALETCHKILTSLKTLHGIDVSQNRRFAFAIADMRQKKLELFLEEALKLCLGEIDPAYLEEDHVTEGQRRSMGISHRLDLFVDRLCNQIPDLTKSDETIEEISLLTPLWTTLHRYRATDTDNSLHTTLQTLQTQSRMCIELAKENISDEASQWFIKHYGQNMEDWNKLYDDQTQLFQQIFSTGLPSLKFISKLFDYLRK